MLSLCSLVFTDSEDRLILEALDYKEQFSFKELMANWSKVSISIKKLRDNPLDAEQEEKSYLDKETNILKQHINFLIPKSFDNFSKPSLAVIREHQRLIAPTIQASREQPR